MNAREVKISYYENKNRLDKEMNDNREEEAAVFLRQLLEDYIPQACKTARYFLPFDRNQIPYWMETIIKPKIEAEGYVYRNDGYTISIIWGD